MGRADLLDTMTVPEVAERLRTNVEHVRALIRSGKLEAVKLGREYRVYENQLMVFIDGLKNNLL